jgi:hypothetical protein
MGQNIGIQVQNPGGNQSVLGLSAAGSIATNPLPLRGIIIQNPGTAGSWLIVDGSLQGAYSATQSYTAGQIATYSATTYICILASTGNLPTNATYWATTPPATSVLWQAAYNGTGIAEGVVLQPNFRTYNGIYLWTVPTAGVLNVGFG